MDRPQFEDQVLDLKTQKGLTVRRNQKNGYISVGLHYTADPGKDPSTPEGAIWYERERKKWSAKRWATDFEMSRVVYGGDAVFGSSFEPRIHAIESKEFALDPKQPILLGWDFGGNQSISFAQRQGQTLFIFDELPNYGRATAKVAPKLIRHISEHYPEFHFIHVPDPTGFDKGRNDAEGVSNIEVLERFFQEASIPFFVINLNKKLNKINPRIDAVLELLDRNFEGRPLIQICKDTCPMIFMGFNGSYQWDTDKNKGFKKKAGILDNEFTHIMDTVQYLAIFINSKVGEKYLNNQEYLRQAIRKINYYETPTNKAPKYRL